MSIEVKHELVVTYNKIDGLEKFNWYVTGAMPTLACAGAIADIQTQMIVGNVFLEKRCDSKLVIRWIEDSKEFDLSVDTTIPKHPLIGYLEIIKQVVLDTVHNVAKTPPIIDIHGRPLNRN